MILLEAWHVLALACRIVPGAAQIPLALIVQPIIQVTYVKSIRVCLVGRKTVEK